MKTKNYKEDLLNELKNPEYASTYLAQALESGDQAVFLLALRDVVEAGTTTTEDPGAASKRCRT